MVSDEEYFAQRAQSEREAAAKAICPEATKAHLDLATRYESLVDALRDEHRRMGVGASDVEPKAFAI
ncbi:hypothetical protein QUB53_29065 [Microcoleus sp. AT8-B4]|uniref:hypothetical protein n=1 Tax=Microcoleus sp. AT8-B4 TaxID=2818620 RepID=UPI002FD267F7